MGILTQRQRKALVFSPGGISGGCYILGVLFVLLRRVKKFEGVTGNSIGAVIAGFVGQTPYGDEQGAIVPILNALRQLKVSDFIESTPPPSLQDFKITRFLNSRISQRKTIESGREVTCGAYDIVREDYHLFRMTNTREVPPNLFAGSMVCSSTIPTVMYTKKVDSMLLVDGGFKSVIPLRNLEHDYDIYFLILTMSEEECHVPSQDPIYQEYKNVWKKDYNDLPTSLNLVKITPTSPLPGMEEPLNLNPEIMIRCFRIGVYSARLVLGDAKASPETPKGVLREIL